MRQKLIQLKEEIDKSTITVGDFNIFLSIIDRSSRQKMSKEIPDENNTINHFDLHDSYRILNLTIAKFTFFPSTHGPFTNRLHLRHLKHFNTFKRIEITQSMYSNYCNPSY